MVSELIGNAINLMKSIGELIKNAARDGKAECHVLAWGGKQGGIFPWYKGCPGNGKGGEG